MSKLIYDFLLKFYAQDFDLPITNALNHVLIVAITVNIIYRCMKLKFEGTAMHAYLCTLGLMLLMSESMMVRYKGNTFYDTFSHHQNFIHGCLQIIGGALVLLGGIHKYLNKQRHFISSHGKWGLYGCIFCVLNIICGLCSILIPRPYSIQHLFHGTLDMITYIVCMWAQITGYQTGFFHRNFVYKRTYKVATFVVLFLTAFGPMKIAFRKFLE